MANQIFKLKIPVIIYGVSKTAPLTYSVSSNNINTISYTSSNVRSVVFLDANLDNIRKLFNNIDGSYEVQSAELSFYTKQNDDTHYLHVGEAGLVIGEFDFGAFFENLISSSPFYSQKLQASSKQYHNIPLGRSSSAVFCSRFTDALLGAYESFFLGIYVSNVGDSVYCANEMLAGEETEWTETTDVSYQDTECSYLTIEVKLTQYTSEDFDLYYTNIDPANLNASSKGSMGGYATNVSLYTGKSIRGGYGPNDTVISIDGTGTPDESTLCQIGPELVSVIGSDNSTINLLRGTNQKFGNYSIPGLSRPSRIRYLDVDGLFDSSPINNKQLRCVALRQILGEGFLASNVSVKLIKSDSKDFKIDIGIEVPRHDSYLAETKISIDSGTNIISCIGLDIIELANGFFNGSHLTIDPDGESNGPITTVIESFSVSSGTAEFITSDSLPSFVASTPFIVHPAPAQRINLDTNIPIENSGRFFGFLDDGSSNNINYNDIRQNGSTMRKNDLIYLWIKRTVNPNSKNKSNTGAIISVIYN